MEPYPIAVTRSRFPRMTHLGDISKIDGAKIEPVDIITFGSPCQDLSTAGKMEGIREGTRSGLFIEAVRIIKEMREATDGKYPTFALWENVPGALSSNKGEDFRLVLDELIKIVEPCASVPPVPPFGWPYADSHVGDGWNLAYRVLDAQHWGVPQRRRRVHLVLDLRGQRARQVLFEREGLRGDIKQSRAPREGTRTGAQGGAGSQGKTFILDFIGGQGEYARASLVNPTLRAAGAGAIAHSVGLNGSQVCSTLIAGLHRTVGTTQDNLIVTDYSKENRYIVRRLTPTECARLQGFADRWGDIEKKESLTDEEFTFWHEVRNTHAAINGRAVKNYTRDSVLKWYNKLQTDSAEYKMWGNGIALPTALYCMQGMAEALKK